MKKIKTLKKFFGSNEYGLIDFPKKISNVQISRILYGDEMGCSWCFPHGFETINSKEIKIQRNWKNTEKPNGKPKSKCRKTELLRTEQSCIAGKNPVSGIRNGVKRNTQQ